MNMPPPHGAGHPGQSPSMQARQYPQSHAFLQQQQAYQAQQQAYLDAAGRGNRKRKLTTQNAHLARRPSGHTPHTQQQHPQHAAAYRHPPSAFLGLNLPATMADELPDSIVDDLDRLTPRDLAVARYARNHELLSTVFDARRIDSLHPAPSPYAQVAPAELQAKVDALNTDISQLSSAHTHKMTRVRHIIAGKADADDAETEPEPWARGAFRGKVLGLGFVRAPTPDELKHKPAPSEPAPETEAEQKRKHDEREAIEKLNASLGPEAFEEAVAPPAAPADVPPAPVPTHVETADNTAQTTVADALSAADAAAEAMDTSTSTST